MENKFNVGTKVIYSVFPLFHQVVGVITENNQITITDPQCLEMCKNQGVSSTVSLDEVHEIFIVH